jgi:CTP:molybdopterin cytidylyltransferase MocA
MVRGREPRTGCEDGDVATQESPTRIAGLVLAAGEGRRMGVPKALLRDASGTTWVVRTVRVLAEAGVAEVVVVVGAAADEVRRALLHEDVRVVHADGWAEGMGASLRAGLAHLAGAADADTAAGPGDSSDPGHAPLAVDAVLVCVVDTPGLNAAVVRRVAAHARRDALVRATYDGTPGHPVVLGAAHLPGIRDSAAGDVGARDYLRRHAPVEVECADLATGTDVDHPADLPPGHHLG